MQPSAQTITEEGSAGGMRVAVVIQTLDALGGKERDALAIAGGLAARGHKVEIVTRSAQIAVPSGVGLRAIGSRGWTNHGRAQHFARAVAALRDASSFDAVLSFDKLRNADAYYAADVCFACRDLGFKGWLPRYATYARLERQCFGAGGPAILFLCRKQESEYRSQYRLDADRAVVLPPMIHDVGERSFYATRAAVRQRFGIPDAATLAVSVAVYPEQKGIDRTIAAFADVPGVHMLAVGLNDTVWAENFAAKRGVEGRVRFLGHRDDVADIIGAADLMLHPARLENTGLVILESLLAGVPVIASAVCGFAEYIARSGAGMVLAEPFNAGAYVAAIRAALEPHTLAELKQRARTAAPQLRAEGGVARNLDVIENILRRAGKRN